MMGPSPLARGKLVIGQVVDRRQGTIPARAGETWRWRRTRAPARDHPRSRGGNLSGQERKHLPAGPSPLARGKQLQLDRYIDDAGTIPARAGETKRTSTASSPPRDHPRSRGGNHVLAGQRAECNGPSPLARGKLKSLPNELFMLGTIPARAGETWQCQGGGAVDRDHPRSRGGNRATSYGVPGRWGPSPLARGKLLGIAFFQVGVGTIPARAGETRTGASSLGRVRDHPRSRGGNRDLSNCSDYDEGPSPLARGKRKLLRCAASIPGTIPARAGETVSAQIHQHRARDHPRSRGGNSPGRLLPRIISGPSPLARGKQRYAAIRTGAMGTIPARAGETVPALSGASAEWDHPRSRGGNSTCDNEHTSASGPSPLARGKPKAARLRRGRRGTIPARAGETVLDHFLADDARDHPRSRGGNGAVGVPVRLGEGPSPLARGKPEHGSRHGTHVGDHPRSRGGNSMTSIKRRRLWGPSPLARGKQS